MALQGIELLGTFPAGIVGCIYQNVRLNADDGVHLECEPDNPHDVSAVMVLNATGRQVGYLKRELAEVVAPIMDEGTLQFSAFVPAARIHDMTDYFIPLEIQVYGQGPAAEAALQELTGEVQGFSADGRLLFQGQEIIINFGRYQGLSILRLAELDPGYIADFMLDPKRGFSEEVHMRVMHALNDAGMLHRQGDRFILGPAQAMLA